MPVTTARRLLSTWTVALLTTAVAAAADPAPRIDLNHPFAGAEWSLTDIDGTTHHPWSKPETRAVVLVFISPDCPVANYFQPTLRRIIDQYQSAGVEFYFVHPLPQVTAARARQHVQDYSIPVPVVLDPRMQLARASGAKKTPEAAVVNRNGAIAYLGRIDDTFVGFGKRRAQPTQNNLRDAIGDVVAGRLVPVPRTEAVGCFIPYQTASAGR